MAEESPRRKAIDSTDLEGMDVKDTDAEVLGTVASLQIDPGSLAVAGIVVTRGYLDKDVLVGVEYVDRIDTDAVWLNVDLTLFIEGRTVIDREGNEVGTVQEIDRVRDTNAMKGLVVAGPEGEVYINAKEIARIQGDRVYLQ